MSEDIRKMIDKVKNFKQPINESINTKSAVNFIYEKHPELNNIGTQEEYAKYLDTIFPSSKVKGVLYHRSPQDFDKFDKTKIKDANSNRFYFSPFNTGRYGNYVKLAVLNIKNLADPYNPEFMNDVNKRHPEYTKGKSEYFHLPSQIYVNADKYGYDGVFAYEGTNDDEYSVYEPEQIHLLGTKQDIEGFKKFVTI